jgi:putative long chain acyl-CoA synthase
MTRGKRSERAIDRVENVLELLLGGSLSTPYSAPYRVVRQQRTYAIRHYGEDGAFELGSRPPVLFIPPLMVTSEVFDIDPAISGVEALMNQGIDVWLTDFGAPESQEGGMERTLRDHVLAVSETIDEIVRQTQRDVHLIGYSQGGMFAYETAAFRHSEGIASCVTLGTPVDFQGNFDGVLEETARSFLRGAVTLFRTGMDTAKGFSAGMTGGGFRAIGLPKEPGQLMSFFKQLHDRTALEQRERRREFLRGGGFVGFPGPALNDVIDLVVENRLVKGGFVIDGKAVSLVDIRCPILYFIGTSDALVGPSLVSAITQAAPNAPCYESKVEAGHFGVVVGHKSAEATWPRIGQWVHWLERGGDLPAHVVDARDLPAAASSTELRSLPPAGRRVRLLSAAAKATASRVGSLLRDAAKRVDQVKWEAPRIRRMQGLRGDARVGMALFVEEQAAVIPDETFFLWEGRAFSYEQVNQRVDAVARGLIHCGIRPEERVAVLMKRRPSYLSAVAALNRIGAVSVPLGTDDPVDLHRHALDVARVRYVIADPETAQYAKDLNAGPVLVLGGGPGRPPLPQGVVDMELIRLEELPRPAGYVPNARNGRDLAMLLVAGGVGDQARLARITNQRWAFAALGGATFAALTPRDTVYCCTGLNHPTGIMVATGAALVGGARLALADRFDGETFWHDVRQSGATVVFYSGEMGRELLNVAPSSADRAHPLRLLCGSGMRADTWRKIQRRFGPVSIVETYGSTEGNALIANVTGEKVGSVGRPVPGSVEVALVRYDFDRGDFVRGDAGHLMTCAANEPGILISKVDSEMPVSLFDGYAEAQPDEQRLIKGAFHSGDTWFNSQDVLRWDADGDYWYVGRLLDMVRGSVGVVSTWEIEEALCHVSSVRLAAVWADPGEPDRIVGALSLKRGATLDLDELGRSLARFESFARPVRLAVLDSLPVTGGFRPLKALARVLADQSSVQVVWESEAGCYRTSVGEGPRCA